MAAAFSRHLGAAAARHLAGAARAATRRDRDNDDEDVDLELGASSDSSSTDDEDGNGGAVGDGSNGNGGAVGDGSNGTAGAGEDGGASGGGGGNDDASGAGGDAGGVDPEDIVALLENSYELFGVLIGMIPPVPVYFILPQGTRDSTTWIWCLLAYAIVFTVLVTAISVRVFRSRCCLSTTLRALLLVISVLAEVLASLHFVPSSTNKFAAGPAYFSLAHLLAVYLGVWACSGRRR